MKSSHKPVTARHAGLHLKAVHLPVGIGSNVACNQMPEAKKDTIGSALSNIEELTNHVFGVTSTLENELGTILSSRTLTAGASGKAEVGPENVLERLIKHRQQLSELCAAITNISGRLEL